MYTPINSLSATPSPASPGAVIAVVLTIQNIYSAPISILGDLTFTSGGVIYLITYDTRVSDTINPGLTMQIMGHFTMPNSAVTVTAHSYWYGSDGQWHLDDTQTVSINVQQLTVQISEFKILDFNTY